MKNENSVNKASQKSKDEKVQGYFPRNCDFKCHKCNYQGVCIVPRMLIEARRRYMFGIENKKFFLNRKYELNNLTLSLYGRIFKHINKFSRLNKNFNRYRRKSRNEINGNLTHQ
jgi:hypothetical protein